MDPALRIVVVSREPVVRLGLEALIERAGMMVAGSVPSCTDVVDVVAMAPPSVVLIARFTEATPVIDQVLLVRAAAATTPVVVLGVDAPADIAASIQAGASSWISARAPTTEIAAALRAVAAGLVVVSRSSTHALVQKSVPAPMPRRSVTSGRVPAIGPRAVPPRTNQRSSLGERERELLDLLAGGRTRAEIAEAMGSSLETVNKTVQTLTERVAHESPLNPAAFRDETA